MALGRVVALVAMAMGAAVVLAPAATAQQCVVAEGDYCGDIFRLLNHTYSDAKYTAEEVVGLDDEARVLVDDVRNANLDYISDICEAYLQVRCGLVAPPARAPAHARPAAGLLLHDACPGVL